MKTRAVHPGGRAGRRRIRAVAPLVALLCLASCRNEDSSGRRPAAASDSGGAPAAAPDLPFPLVAHAACAERGRIWLTGGSNEKEQALFLSWAPPEGRWKDEGRLPAVAVFHGACALNGFLYFFGGLPDSSQAWRCDLATKTWERLPALPTPRSRMRATAFGETIYVIGGYTSGPAAGNTGACEAYDPREGRWTARAPMPTPRHGHTVVAIGGTLVVTGGGSGDPVEIYDPATNVWRASEPTPRVYAEPRPPFNLLFHEAVAWEGRVLHFGSREYDPIPVLAWRADTGAWEVAAERGPLRHRFASARLGHALYLIGGETSAPEGPHAFKDVEAVDLRAFSAAGR